MAFDTPLEDDIISVAGGGLRRASRATFLKANAGDAAAAAAEATPFAAPTPLTTAAPAAGTVPARNGAGFADVMDFAAIIAKDGEERIRATLGNGIGCLSLRPGSGDVVQAAGIEPCTSTSILTIAMLPDSPLPQLLRLATEPGQCLEASSSRELVRAKCSAAAPAQLFTFDEESARFRTKAGCITAGSLTEVADVLLKDCMSTEAIFSLRPQQWQIQPITNPT